MRMSRYGFVHASNHNPLVSTKGSSMSLWASLLRLIMFVLVAILVLSKSTTAFIFPAINLGASAHRSVAAEHRIPSRDGLTFLKQVPSKKSDTVNKKRKKSPRKANGTSGTSMSTSKNRLKKPDLRAQLDYARNGHTVLRDLLDPTELTSLRDELWELGKQRELEAWRQKVEVAGDSAELAASCRTVKACRKELSRLGVPGDYLPFLQYFNNWMSLPAVYRLVVKLAETAAVLMNVESVRLYQDSLFWKRPGDGPTPWHTDARMAPFDTSHIVTLWIPLQLVPKEGTGLMFCSKSHADFALPFWNPVDQTENNSRSPWNNLEQRYANLDDAHLVDYMPLQTGDVTAHAGWTLHCAEDGVLDSDRLALAITFVDSNAEVRESVLTDTTGDNEDVWSYRDWVNEVPARTRGFRHKRVPIVWPQSKQNKRIQ